MYSKISVLRRDVVHTCDTAFAVVGLVKLVSDVGLTDDNFNIAIATRGEFEKLTKAN